MRKTATTTAAAKERSAKKGKRKRHSEQNEALCHEQNGDRKQRYVSIEKQDDDTKNKEVTFIVLKKKHEINALK